MSRFADFQDVNIKNAFREYVRAKMQAQSISRQLLIRRSGVSESTIERILRADQNNTPKPTQTSIDAVLGVLKLSTKDFLDYLYSDSSSKQFDTPPVVLNSKPIPNRNFLTKSISGTRLKLFHIALSLMAIVSIVAITSNISPPQLTIDNLIEDTKIFYTLESHVEKLTATIARLEQQLEQSKDEKEIAELQRELSYCESSLSELQNSYDAQISMIRTTVLFLNQIKHLLDVEKYEPALLELSAGKYERTIKIFKNLLNGDHIANALAKELELLLLTMATSDLTIRAGFFDSSYGDNNEIIVAQVETQAPATDIHMVSNGVKKNSKPELDKIKNSKQYRVLFDRMDLRSDYLEVTSRMDENWIKKYNGLESSAKPLYDLYRSQYINSMGHFQLSGDTFSLKDDGIHDISNEEVTKLQRPDTEMRGFPRDDNFIVDWVRALNNGTIKPQTAILGNDSMNTRDSDVILKNTATMPYVRFSHRTHTSTLTCENCHSAIFLPEKGVNVMTMTKIIKGKYCGLCHGKVAFPLYNCGRCHNVSQVAALTRLD